MLFAGFLAARIISRGLGNRLLSRFGLNENAAGAIQSLSFYLLLIIFAWMALRFANIPLTVFAFLGGAIAIGVGFGSQNILNNFISGLILLAERPIRLGDLIQLENLYGNVVRIGARSTRVRTGNNLDIVVPNSKFLENNVVNLTLGDDKYRTHVAVGVAYGSPTRDVSRLMKHAVEEHGRILDRPEPIVLFSDFGDNALIFEVHFWVTVRSVMDRLRIESDIRFRIDHLFSEAGVVIAFPQRDVHFDTDSPFDVRLLPSQGTDSVPASSQVEETT